ncbi:MAG: SDR family oxidoreductase [Bacteroidota bacterium]
MDILKGKTIVITGASKGIGKATAIKFSKIDTNLVLLARSLSELELVQKEVIANGSKCEIFCGDVGDAAFINNSIETTRGKFGKIDVVINNAGYGIFKPADEITEEEWDNIFATNTKGTFLVSKAVIPIMKENKVGHIINIASDVAKRTFANGSLYCASKYAQDAFSSALRKELRPFNIKVSVVYSGLVDSYFHSDPQGDESHDDWLKNEDMANAIIYIASQPAHVVIDELMIHPLSQDY